MPKIPIDLTKNPVATPKTTARPLDAGLAKYKAAERTGEVIADIGKMSSDLGLQYKKKNKKADMMADELKYRAHKKTVLINATDAASRTTDKDEISKIYDNAQKDLDGYAGKSSGGIPNIRWKDQAGAINGDANNFRVTMEGEKLQRQLAVYQAESNATADSANNTGRLTRDYDLIDQSVAVKVEAATLTPEQGELWKEESIQVAEKLDIKKIGDRISVMEPEDVAEAKDFFMGKVDAGRYRGIHEKKEIEASWDAAVQTAENKAYYEERRQAAAAARVIAQNSKDMLAQSAIFKADAMDGMSSPEMAEYAKSFGETDAYMASQSKKWESSTFEEQNKMYATDDYNELRSDIRTYDQSKDKDKSKMRALIYRTNAYGKIGENMLTELDVVMNEGRVGKVESSEWVVLNQDIERSLGVGEYKFGGFDEPVIKKDGRVMREAYAQSDIADLPIEFQDIYRTGGTEKTPKMESLMEIRIKSWLKQKVVNEDLTLEEARQELANSPMMVDIKNGNLAHAVSNWAHFDRTKRWTNVGE